MPEQAITVTVPALLRAGRVIAVVPEARKAEPVLHGARGPGLVGLPGFVRLRTKTGRDASPRPGVPPARLTG